MIDFSRNLTDFALNHYTKLTPVDKMTGYYLEMTLEEAARVLSADDAEHDWPDGADAPDSNDGTESFEFKDFKTRRKAYTARLGNLGTEQASWDIIAQHSRIKAQQAMTARTMEALGVLTNVNNYLTGHQSNVADISGNSGTWAQSTSGRQDIQRTINHIAKTIGKATLSTVKKKDLVLVVSPDAATEIAESQEIVEMLKGSRYGAPYIEGKQWDNSDWGLPGDLYGVKLVVEDAVKVTSRKGASAVAKDYVLAGADAMIVARPGALEGMYGSPEFSSCSIFVYSDFETYTKNDKDNEVTKIRIVDNRKAVMTAPVSSFLLSNVI